MCAPAITQRRGPGSCRLLMRLVLKRWWAQWREAHEDESTYVYLQDGCCYRCCGALSVLCR